MTQTKNKIIALFVATLLAVCIPFAVRSDNTSPTIKISAVSVNKLGECEVIGYINNSVIGADITLLSLNKNTTNGLVPENIIHINQTRTGNNGTFLFKFQISEKFSGQTGYVFVNSNQKTQKVMSSYTIPQLPPGIDVIENNSVMYGKDVYYVPGSYHNANNIAESLAYGGNSIYFKMGGYWYDLLNGNATSNYFLVPENAVNDTEIEAVKPRIYYMTARKTKLKY